MQKIYMGTDGHLYVKQSPTLVLEIYFSYFICRTEN